MNVTELKDSMLGKRYDLSVAFLNPREMRAVDKKYPHPKNPSSKGPSNVLAFPLSKNSGEILLCKETANRQAASFGMSQRNFITYLLIHGMLHLKGRRHGATMESEERRALKRLGVRVRNE